MPKPEASNYLLALSTSERAFDGVYPTLRTTTSVSKSPVSGSGIIMNNRGGTWNYSYAGTATTTATTTSQVNVPYTDTASSIYLHAYDQAGALVSNRWETMTNRQGGDASNTLGYNIGAALIAIHAKQRLLGSVVTDVYKTKNQP